jgi:hypothetical protein
MEVLGPHPRPTASETMKGLTQQFGFYQTLWVILRFCEI